MPDETPRQAHKESSWKKIITCLIAVAATVFFGIMLLNSFAIALNPTASLIFKLVSGIGTFLSGTVATWAFFSISATPNSPPKSAFASAIVGAVATFIFGAVLWTALTLDATSTVASALKLIGAIGLGFSSIITLGAFLALPKGKFFDGKKEVNEVKRERIETQDIDVQYKIDQTKGILLVSDKASKKQKPSYSLRSDSYDDLNDDLTSGTGFSNRENNVETDKNSEVSNDTVPTEKTESIQGPSGLTDKKENEPPHDAQSNPKDIGINLI